ncbi:MAG: hypothetical protein NUV73_00780 [Candidatus Daviesbacteria bacterium]|nr:hypothetical protein [Candidatus Daviesbacteria bacterium]
MSIQEVINILLVIGLLIISACIVTITFFLIKALKAITNLADSLQDTSQSIREKIQMRFLAALPAIVLGMLGKILKRGR